LKKEKRTRSRAALTRFVIQRSVVFFVFLLSRREELESNAQVARIQMKSRRLEMGATRILFSPSTQTAAHSNSSHANDQKHNAERKNHLVKSSKLDHNQNTYSKLRGFLTDFPSSIFLKIISKHLVLDSV